MNNYFLKLFSMFDKEPFYGVIGDGSGDVYEQSEIVASYAPADLKEKKRSEWITYFPQYQYTSSACVAYTTAKIASTLYFNKTGRKVRFSPAFYYVPRVNKPGLGMHFDDVQYLATKGAVPHELLPCEGMNEDEINAIPLEWYHFEVGNAFAMPKRWINVKVDFDIVASTIKTTKKGVMLWFKFGPGEWNGMEVPIIKTNPKFTHSGTGVDAFKENGVEYILVEDSADKVKWQKKITRDFFTRCILARYPMNFVFGGAETKPFYDGSIISLQYCLEYEGFFPNNVSKVENIGKVTREAISQFQAKYGIIVTGTLTPSTENKIKELYAKTN